MLERRVLHVYSRPTVGLRRGGKQSILNNMIRYCIYDGARFKTIEEAAPKKIQIDRLIEKTDSIPRVDTALVRQILFPYAEGSIFISHFYDERDYAMKIRDRISAETGLKCFIDSEVWGSVYDLLDALQGHVKKWNMRSIRTDNISQVYSLEECNDVAKNVFSILSLALQDVVLHSPVFIFVSEEKAEQKIKDQILVGSPWVAQEIYTSSLRNVSKKIFESIQANMSKKASVEFIHTVSVAHLKEGSVEDIIKDLKSCI